MAPAANDTIKIKTYLTNGLTSHGVLEITASVASSAAMTLGANVSVCCQAVVICVAMVVFLY